ILANGGLVHTVDYQDPIMQIATAAVVYTTLFPATAGSSGGGSSALDLVFAIDTTGSMSPYIASTVASAQSVLAALSAKKVDIQMGDAPGKDPEPHSGLTLAKVTAHALAVDPAIVDPILVGSDGEAHQFDQALADATGGQTFDATGDPSSVGPVIVNAVGS